MSAASPSVFALCLKIKIAAAAVTKLMLSKNMTYSKMVWIDDMKNKVSKIKTQKSEAAHSCT